MLLGWCGGLGLAWRGEVLVLWRVAGGGVVVGCGGDVRCWRGVRVVWRCCVRVV